MDSFSRSIAIALSGLAPVLAAAAGALENPVATGRESGIAAITGWHCTSRDIEIRIDGVSIGKAGAGTSRADTQATCGRSDTGFSLLLNYALLRGGTHRVDAYADGLLFGSATFQAGYLGAEFLTGASASHEIPDFPVRGQKTKLSWSQAKQNLVIERVDSLLAGTLVGTYSIRHVSVMSTSTGAASTLQPGASVSGSWTYRPNGTYSMNISITGPGGIGSSSADGTYTDLGYYVIDTGSPVLVVERGETLTLQALMSQPEVAAMVISMVRSPAGTALSQADEARVAKDGRGAWAAILSAAAGAGIP